ncbi:MAG: fatty acid desaturase [Robiginitomaculum sp.]|nr:MAG: fatty acid desaturase [Robiginitomaculum sp.]
MTNSAKKIAYIPKHEVKQLSARSDLVGFLLVAHCWGTIILAGAFFIYWPNPLSFVLAVAIIGSRQLGMSILMHDAAHGILFKTAKFNTLFAQIFLASPVGANIASYRKYHLTHHLNTQQDNDPDLPLSAAFPITRKSFVRKMVRDMTGQTAFKLRYLPILSYIKNRKASGSKNTAFYLGNLTTPILSNLILFGLCWATGYWWAYFALWIVPLYTVFQVVVRIRNIAEHAMTSHEKNPLINARTTYANWLERVFVAPYWVNYHVEHHAYMFVPCWQLKKLHAAMVREGHLPDMEIKHSYREVLKFAVPS